MEISRMSHKRIWLGLASLILAHIILSMITQAILPESTASITAQSIVVQFLAAIVGGFVARERFILVAMGVWAALWAAVLYTLYLIAVPTGQASILSIIQHNVVTLLLSGAATVVGVHLGQALATLREKHAAAT